MKQTILSQENPPIDLAILDEVIGDTSKLSFSSSFESLVQRLMNSSKLPLNLVTKQSLSPLKFGIQGVAVAICSKLGEQLYSSESCFTTGDTTRHDGILELRGQGINPREIFTIDAGHLYLSSKTSLLTTIYSLLLPRSLGTSVATHFKDFNGLLQKFTRLQGFGYGDVSVCARQLLISSTLPSFAKRAKGLEANLSTLCQQPGGIEKLAWAVPIMNDILVSSFFNSPMAKEALQVYIHRIYRAYEIKKLVVQEKPFSGCNFKCQWQFQTPLVYNSESPSFQRKTSDRENIRGAMILSDSAVDLAALESASAQSTSPANSLSSPSHLSNTLDLNSLESLGSPSISQSTLSRKRISTQSSRWGFLLVLDPVTSTDQVEKSISKSFDNYLIPLLSTIDPVTGQPPSEDGSPAKSPPQKNAECLVKPINNLTFVFKIDSPFDESQLISGLELLFQSDPISKQLKLGHIRRVTAVFQLRNNHPRYYNFHFRSMDGGKPFSEESVYRHIEPTLAYELEIFRLSNYKITRIESNNNAIHVYYGVQKGDEKSKNKDCRFFVQSSVRQKLLVTDDSPDAEFHFKHGEQTLIESLDALECAFDDPKYKGQTDSNRIFLNYVPTISMPEKDICDIIATFTYRHAYRLLKLRVSTAEVKIRHFNSETKEASTLRFIGYNPSGYVLNVDVYKEVTNPGSNKVTLKHLFGIHGDPLTGGHLRDTAAMGAISLNSRIHRKRKMAQAASTSYVYDFPQIIQSSLRSIWEKAIRSRSQSSKPYKAFDDPWLSSLGISLEEGQKWFDLSKQGPNSFAVCSCVELVVQNGELAPINRPSGRNTIGMVAWLFTFYSPEYPHSSGGRQLMFIANDITIQAGSFSVEEDDLFFLASKYARERGIPRIYITANSGARIGLAKELKNKFYVKWNHSEDPSKGFKYLYLSDSDYQGLKEFVHTTKVEEEDGSFHWKLDSIIGKDNGLGVENLSGSGLIAGETARAYNETCTLSIVSGRSVGIGAYLVRLGQRTIQNEATPILLTGARALNNVLGREVYSSNAQLGGIKIMYSNGVSHLVARNDQDAIDQMFDWVRFIPRKSTREFLPLLAPLNPFEADPPLRSISYVPPVSGTFNPRNLIAGDGSHTGLFDIGSFSEILGGWAKTVICGRATLGGIPCGVISVENRTMEKIVPADPANPSSTEQKISQAGQVWFPDSASKTATAIKDFSKENLPLFILASWRGFSGGQRDMFDEILKFGSEIVFGLVSYKRPVFVYLPPKSELRGGAWVVLDSLINPDYMEMYASKSSRGGILEPAGVIGVKFRANDRAKTMNRLDQHYASLYADSQRVGLSNEETTAIKSKLGTRYDFLYPIYQNIATTFADLHDTPERMLSKKVIRSIVPWTGARHYFYTRLVRLLHQDDLASILNTICDFKSRSESIDLIKNWFFTDFNSSSQYTTEALEEIWQHDNEQVTAWLTRDRKTWVCLFQIENGTAKFNTATDRSVALTQSIPAKLVALHQFQTVKMLSSIELSNTASLVSALENRAKNITAEQRNRLLALLKNN